MPKQSGAGFEPARPSRQAVVAETYREWRIKRDHPERRSRTTVLCAEMIGGSAIFSAPLSSTHHNREVAALSCANPKIEGEQAGGSTRRSAAEPGPSSRSVRRSGGGLQGDSVAECFELAEVVALLALSVDAGVVEAGAKIMEAGGGVGQQMPDDDQNGAADRDDGSLGAAPPGDPGADPRRRSALRQRG